jgi:hypothetical protein
MFAFANPAIEENEGEKFLLAIFFFFNSNHEEFFDIEKIY